jgi:predicted membrane chloride channel (bestrophin family)
MNTYVHLSRKNHQKMANLVIAYLISLKHHIQGESILSELTPFLQSTYECQKILQRTLTVRNGPNHLLRCLAAEVHSALKDKYEDPILAALHEQHFASSFHSMAAAAASCERIVKQPVPASYTRHTSRFLSLYLLTLPLTLIPSLGWAAVPTMVAISWSFLSVHEIGLFIEDPFNKDLQVIPLNQFILVARSDILGE